MIAGKMARIKLNATADARKLNHPSCKPFTKKAVTSYNGSPSNPGIRTSFEKRMMFRMIGKRRNLTMSFLTISDCFQAKIETFDVMRERTN